MPVSDNFYKPPYPAGKYSHVRTYNPTGAYPSPIEDFDPTTILSLRNFIASVELVPLTLKDLEYHTMEYLDGLPLSRLSQTSAKAIGGESWYGGGLTQADLNTYKQEDLNVLTQHGIEQAPGIGPKVDLNGKTALEIRLDPGDDHTYSSIYENDNLVAAPFNDTLGVYLIQSYMWAFGGKTSGDLHELGTTIDLEASYLSFSSTLDNDPGFTDIIYFDDMTISNSGDDLNPSLNNFATASFNRDLIVNADKEAIKRIDVHVKALDDNTEEVEFGIMDLRMFDSTDTKYSYGINTKTGKLSPIYWYRTDLTTPPVYNVGQNKVENYTYYTRVSIPEETVDSYITIHHRIGNDSFPRASVRFKYGVLETSVEHIVWGTPSTTDKITGFPSGDALELLIQSDLEEDMIRTLIWKVNPGESKGELLYNSQGYTTTPHQAIGIPPGLGRVAIEMGSSTIHTGNPAMSADYAFARDTVIGEMKTYGFNTITPMLGATLYSNSSPPRQLIENYFGGQEGPAYPHLGGTFDESGKDSGEFDIIPGRNDVTTSLDTNRTYGGLPSYRVRKHSNAIIGGVQWKDPIRISDPARSSVSGAVRFDNNLLGGHFRVVFWDEWRKNVMLILPLVIEDTPGKWHPFEIPLATDNIMELKYNVQFQHVGPSSGVGSFWLGDFRVQTGTIEWGLSNDGGVQFVEVSDSTNSPFSAANFITPGKILVARARAYHPSAWINRFEITPRWDKTGVQIPVTFPELSYETLPEVMEQILSLSPGEADYEDLPISGVFDLYEDLQD